MKTSEQIAKIAPALVAAGAELQPVAKDATNPAFRNKYATLDAIMEQVRPVLAKHGLTVLQGVTHPETIDGRITGLNVETRLIHVSGEWISSSVTLPVEKTTAQGAGSAISYGRRYGLSALLGLTAEDDDGNAASSPAQAAPRASRPAAPEVEPGKRLHESVPETPVRKPWNGDVKAALETKFPFKKRPELAGLPLKEIPVDVLESTVVWMEKTDAAKFADLIARMKAAAEYFWSLHQEQENADAGLPF